MKDYPGRLRFESAAHHPYISQEATMQRMSKKDYKFMRHKRWVNTGNRSARQKTNKQIKSEIQDCIDEESGGYDEN